jgi:hypothetical protein
MRIRGSSLFIETLCRGFHRVNSAPASESEPHGLASWRFKLLSGYGMNKAAMEKIDPQQDHLRLYRFNLGQQVLFRGKPYIVRRRTTLASGEAAVVLQGETDQFVIGAERFLAEVEPKV